MASRILDVGSLKASPMLLTVLDHTNTFSVPTSIYHHIIPNIRSQFLEKDNGAFNQLNESTWQETCVANEEGLDNKKTGKDLTSKSGWNTKDAKLLLRQPEGTSSWSKKGGGLHKMGDPLGASKMVNLDGINLLENLGGVDLIKMQKMPLYIVLKDQNYHSHEEGSLEVEKGEDEVVEAMVGGDHLIRVKSTNVNEDNMYV